MQHRTGEMPIMICMRVCVCVCVRVLVGASSKVFRILLLQIFNEQKCMTATPHRWMRHHATHSDVRAHMQQQWTLVLHATACIIAKNIECAGMKSLGYCFLVYHNCRRDTPNIRYTRVRLNPHTMLIGPCAVVQLRIKRIFF